MLGAIVIGFVAGLIARFFAGNPRDPRGCLLTTFLGIMGGILFTWVGEEIGLYQPGERAGLIGAVLGALVILALWRALLERRRP